MNYNSISDFVIGIAMNFAVVWIIFALLKKGTKDSIVYSLSIIASFCVYYFYVKLTNDSSFMDELGTIVAVISFFFALLFGSICYIICLKIFNGKFKSKEKQD